MAQKDHTALPTSVTQVDPTDLGPLGLLLGLIYISKGTFGIIYGKAGCEEVVKVVEYLDNGDALDVEFELYQAVYTVLTNPTYLALATATRNPKTIFRTPRPLTYHLPANQSQPARTVHAKPPSSSFGSAPPSSPPPPSHNLHECTSDTSDLAGFAAANMTLERIGDLPEHLTATYRSLFWRGALYDSGPKIRLLRLYLGRSFPTTSSLVAPGVASDPPLDMARYTALDESLRSSSAVSTTEGEEGNGAREDEEGRRAGLPNLEAVSRGMGEVLGMIHWGAGTNGRDVELVLGGKDVRCWVLDYNQSAPWLVPDIFSLVATSDPSIPMPMTTGAYASNSLLEASGRLGVLIATQEFYYPRPSSPALYSEFRAGYESAVEGLVLLHTPESTHLRWTEFVKEIRAAVVSFFASYEAVSAARAERASRNTRGSLDSVMI